MFCGRPCSDRQDMSNNMLTKQDKNQVNIAQISKPRNKKTMNKWPKNSIIAQFSFLFVSSNIKRQLYIVIAKYWF